VRLLLLLFFAPLLIYAHQSGLSYIFIDEESPKEITITYKKPLQDLYANNITIHYPQECILLQEKPLYVKIGYIVKKSLMQCGGGGLKNKRIWIKGLLRNDKGVLIRYQNKSFKKERLLRRSAPVITLSKKQSSIELFLDYLKLGISHILVGYDHLLFVLCLLLLARSTTALLFAITAFTVSHSLTLASAMLGIVELPVLFVETMIALSIIFLARELLTPQKTLTKKHLSIISFLFGLLHGFGFSNVLRTIGLPQSDLLVGLFSFNLGIEAGQLLFIAVVLILFWTFKKLFGFSIRSKNTLIAYSIGIAASFWFIERLLQLF
jgi:hydrogenase/urease accessory protein HupE